MSDFLMKIIIPSRKSDKYTLGKEAKITVKIYRKVSYILKKGHTIWFVITRVCYIRDSLYRGGNLYRVWQNPRGQTYFCYTGKFVITGFHIIRIPL